MDDRFISPPRTGTQRSPRGRPVHRENIMDQTRSSGFEMLDGHHSLSTYEDYPPTQPFIYDDYRRKADQPVTAYPQSNRQAVMSALKCLQDKIRQLELERSHAEDNLKTLASETSRYQDILRHGNDDIDHAAPHTSSVSTNTQELESHLQAAETRCNLLEKQLEYMRRIVHTAEADRSEAVHRSQELEAQRAQAGHYEFPSTHNTKVKELEREHLKLTASQTLAETKIRELEEKLREERHHRKLMQEKAAKLETVAETNRILANTNSYKKMIPKEPVPTRKTKKKKVVSQKVRISRPAHTTRDGTDHYRLNLADVPFVAGQSTNPSHSVPANVQRVLSLMKTHNPKLCPCSPRTEVSNGFTMNQTSGSSSSSPPSRNDFSDLLLQLQDEFGHMSFEHQELSRQIHETTDQHQIEDLERELDRLVARMETKGDQIAVITRHKEKMEKKKRKAKASKSRPASAKATIPSTANGEVEVRTTVRTKHGTGSPNVQTYARPTASSAGKASLKFLQDLKKIQSTLRKDDLSWDC